MHRKPIPANPTSLRGELYICVPGAKQTALWLTLTSKVSLSGPTTDQWNLLFFRVFSVSFASNGIIWQSPRTLGPLSFHCDVEIVPGRENTSCSDQEYSHRLEFMVHINYYLSLSSHKCRRGSILSQAPLHLYLGVRRVWPLWIHPSWQRPHTSEWLQHSLQDLPCSSLHFTLTSSHHCQKIVYNTTFQCPVFRYWLDSWFQYINKSEYSK